MEKEIFGDILVVTVAVRDKTNREDIATGSVCLKGLGGENLSNAYMKAETKAKRRATLSICGLAVLDESETDSIAGAERRTVQDLHREPVQSDQPADERSEIHALPPADEAAKPKKRKSDTASDSVEIVNPDAQISVVVNGSGKKVWKVDRTGKPPLAILDEKVAGMLEAILAFGGSAKCAIMLSGGGKAVVTEVTDAKPQ